MAASPTKRTLDRCKKLGWTADVVERYNHHARKSYDWSGFGDILAVQPELPGALLIQATSGAHGAERVKKIVEDCTEAAETWLRAGNRISVWAWRKLKNRGRKQWFAKVYTISLGEDGLVCEIGEAPESKQQELVG